MGSKDCHKYESKAKDYENEIDRLRDRINDLWSIRQTPGAKEQIAKLDYKKKQLEDKRIEALDEFNRCMADEARDYDNH